MDCNINGNIKGELNNMETIMESPMIEDLKEERHILSFSKHLFLKEPAKEFLQELGEINIVTEEN